MTKRKKRKEEKYTEKEGVQKGKKKGNGENKATFQRICYRNAADMIILLVVKEATLPSTFCGSKPHTNNPVSPFSHYVLI